MKDLVYGRTPEQIKIGLRNMLEVCDDPCGVGEVCSEICCAYEGDGCCHETILLGSLTLIERLESERDAALAKVPKWISVEEQPNPPEDGKYWCHGYWLMSGRKQTEVAEYLGEWKIANNFILTHWMPLPEPPKGDA